MEDKYIRNLKNGDIAGKPCPRNPPQIVILKSMGLPYKYLYDVMKNVLGEISENPNAFLFTVI